jgi:hypothetical protein
VGAFFCSEGALSVKKVGSVSQALRQAWWAPLAGLLALGLLVLAFGIGISNSEDDGTTAVIVGVVLCLAGAFALAAGLWKRPHAHGLGNALIVVGCLLAVFWFWTVILPIAGIVVLVGLVSTELRPRRAEVQ